jgi:formate dehydrogenase alpha subunit
MDDTVKLRIDSKELEVESGTTILDAAKSVEIHIPSLCHHPDLEPFGVCRICTVEIEGRGLTISCRTPVEEGMVVKTHSPEIDTMRRTAVELLVVNHATDCLACSKNDDCELQRLSAHVGLERDRLNRLRRGKRNLPLDTSNPFFDRDHNKCVLCGICVRTCAEIQGVNAINFAHRGYDCVISTFADKPILDSRCESCGECVSRCPVGALVPKNYQRPTREVKSVCTYCGVGCNIHLGVRGNTVVGVRADRDNEVNQGSLCVKGRYAYEFINHPDRLTSPLVRKDGELVEATWDEALDRVKSKLSEHKGSAFAALSSARTTNEDNYVFQKFVRTVMETNNVDHCARL